ncbi:MAG: HAD-IIA family hydrolase [Paracoccaceae bacterium]
MTEPGSLPNPADTLADAEAAFRRYEAIRPRLPAATFPDAPDRLPTLAEAADRYDGFILDGFGVLNTGDTPIPGAIARMADLRRRGKRLTVLTNAASYSRSGVVAKYRKLGFDFTPDEVISSRDIAAGRIAALYPGGTWAAIAAEGDDFHDIPAPCRDALADPSALASADGILLLSSQRRTPGLTARIAKALAHRPRPLVIANPDLVAPREDRLSTEPGFHAHAILDAQPLTVHWFGKPFSDAFDEAAARTGLPRARLAMVGDTLHTDILGGRAAGMGTVLVTDHGLFRGLPVGPYIARSGIVPDVIVATT